ncbi:MULTISPECIES: aminoacyl-tRNA deacylase [unclassified Curtobacterium]|uniref:aminoacyl-tRNA deacylase n=1 Tax=unclassified Curtobacterium TaxID=257496 RepID=UPI000F4CBCF8|nr:MULTISPECIES: YbaK/EbsC family protein [unclassified Curtobacterium]ROP65834.1 Cys-tRNA(Pro) deacylase [Curtobacterium sp. ZW137]TCK62930.1 Cys-tRNA(Pro) deacylase [Curtobacterium sp. PhB136]
MTTDPIARFDADAAARGLRVEVVERPAANSLAEAADLLGISPGDIVKTLVVKRHDGDFVLALVPGGRSIAWKKLRTLVGVNKLSMPDAATALEASGYERGTITPIGATGDLPVFADERIVGRRVALGAGRHGASAFVDADDLIAAYGATVADITDEEPARA